MTMDCFGSLTLAGRVRGREVALPAFGGTEPMSIEYTKWRVTLSMIPHRLCCSMLQAFMGRVLVVTIIGKDFATFLRAVEAAGHAANPGDILCESLRRAQLVCLVAKASTAAAVLTRTAVR